MDRKKELKGLYKQMKPDMGIFIVRNKENNKYHIRTTQNLKGIMNSTKFQLSAGNYINKKLQKDWNECGPDKFEIEILDKLEYDKDESKTDYTEELEIMKVMWEEKLSKQNLEQYLGR